MLTEIKYALRSQRLVRVGIMLPLAAVYTIISFCFIYFDLWFLIPGDNKIVTFYGLYNFCVSALPMVCLAGDLMVVKEAYKISCLEYMIPKAGWKRLLSRFGVAMFWDLVCFSVIAVQLLIDYFLYLKPEYRVNQLIEMTVFFLAYWLLVMLCFWGLTLYKTVFAGKKAGKLLSLGGALGLGVIINLVYLLFELMQNRRIMQLINFPFFQPGFWQKSSAASGGEINWFAFITGFMLLSVALIILIFLLTAYLWEKKADL